MAKKKNVYGADTRLNNLLPLLEINELDEMEILMVIYPIEVLFGIILIKIERVFYLVC